nr:Rieske 2Fe-2S domain-containing protein [Henriciella litoralis]
MPIPFGWFGIGYCDELNAGDVKSVRYFGRDLVLFRTEDGKAGLLDAYCPHLGAHLGVGGEIEGDGIRCPFHAWKFDTEGNCKDIPYATQMPPRCKRGPVTDAYPLQEKNGVIWAWHHPDGIEPDFDVIEYPEFTNPEWAEPVRREWRFASNPQEIAENGVDFAHFLYVHKLDAVPEGETTYDGPLRTSEAHGERTLTLPNGETKTMKSSVRTVQNGAGQKMTRFSGIADLSLQVLATPVEADLVELRFHFAHPKFDPDSFEGKIVQMQITSICGQQGVEGDLPIWDTKIHRARPLLCDGDGPILQFRRYFSQFYIGWPKGSFVASAAE